jgi:Ran GTPase-activating protein (RanGAP) involved in mRNA processing and transport
MSNLPDRGQALVDLALDGKNRKREWRDYNSEELFMSSGGLELILGGLLGHPALRILRVTSHGLSEKDIKRLAPYIQRRQQLCILDLSGNGLRIGNVLVISECLSEMPDMVELNARDNNISRSDVCNGIEYRYQHGWVALRMYSKREGRVLIADPCVHAVRVERVHLLHPTFHIGWLMVMKKAHVVRKSKSTVLAFRWPCRFGQS